MLKKFVISVIGIFSLSMFVLVSPAGAVPIVYDHFNDGTLDPAWSITFVNASGWTYNEAGTELTVTDIADTGSEAKVRLSRTFTPLDDFNVDFDFSWDSEGAGSAYQAIFIRLYDSSSNELASAAMYDAWSSSGRKQAMAGGNVYTSGIGSVPLTGSASVDISRVLGNIDVSWDGTSLVTGTSSNQLSRIDVEFWYYNVGFFGSESVDLVSVDDATTAVPEPGTIALLGLGLAGLAGGAVRRRLKKAKQ